MEVQPGKRPLVGNEQQSHILGLRNQEQTKDMGKRLHKHNFGGVYSTKTDRPWELIAYQSVESRAKAILKESELK